MSLAFLIARREFASYFRSWIGPCLVAGMLLVDGLLYYFYNGLDKKLLSGEVLQQFFYTTSGVTMIASILLTMRVLAEERQTGSLVLLNTSPIKDRDIVLGKFLAAYAVLALATLLSVYMPAWLFVQVPEAKAAKNRLHLDFSTADRGAQVARLVALGARPLGEHEEEGERWTVLADPEGNEFCVAAVDM